MWMVVCVVCVCVGGCPGKGRVSFLEFGCMISGSCGSRSWWHKIKNRKNVGTRDSYVPGSQYVQYFMYNNKVSRNDFAFVCD